MSARRSARTKAPVKYTSDSEGSEYGEKPTKRTQSKSQAKADTKKRTKADQDASEAKAEATPKKRTKKDPATLAAEHAEKAQIQEEKATKQQHKKEWEDWLANHDLKGTLLDAEPGKDESITQTDSQKKYGLKPGELGPLKHAEKRHPIYNNTTKLFVEEDVKKLAFRKYGMLAGIEGDESAILKKGEELWKEEHKNDAPTTPKKTDHPPKPTSTSKPKTPKTPKQKWTAYVDTHAIGANDKLDVEPEEAINQTDSKTKYALTPADLAVLPYFPKPNPKYGNTTKLFKESEVKALAYRKAAYLGGQEEGDEEAVLKAGKDLFEAKKDEE